MSPLCTVLLPNHNENINMENNTSWVQHIHRLNTNTFRAGIIDTFLITISVCKTSQYIDIVITI